MLRRLLLVSTAAVALTACAEANLLVHTAKKVDGAVSGTPEGYYKVGRPYQIDGVWYTPQEDPAYVETGIASWYGPDFHGKRTANGELYNQNAVTAAHRTLPMPSIVRVTNLENGRALVVRVNDRGPFARGRIIDLSRRSAQLLGFDVRGTAKVRVELLPEESRVVADLARRGRIIEVADLPQALAEAVVMPANRPVPAPREAVTVAALGSAPSPARVAAAPLPAPSTMVVAPPRQGATPPREAAGERTISRVVTGAPVAPSTLRPEVVATQPELAVAQRQGIVSFSRPGQSEIYVQAGAFLDPDNAGRLRDRLAALGQSHVAPATIDGKQFYRVRVGPLANVEDADRVLARVVEAGNPGARLVVE